MNGVSKFPKFNVIVNQIFERRLLISDVGIIRQETHVWHKFWEVPIHLLLLRYFRLQRTVSRLSGFTII